MASTALTMGAPANTIDITTGGVPLEKFGVNKKHPDDASGCLLNYCGNRSYSLTRTKRKNALVPQFFSTWIPLPTED